MWPWKTRQQDAFLLDIDQRVAKAERRLADLLDRVEDWEGKYATLRGRVYAAGVHRKPLPDSAAEQEATLPRAVSRDEIRKQSGFQPGKPMNHKE